MKNVLITGGAGYIGSELINYLLKAGYSVTCLDNLTYDHTSLLRYTNDLNFNFVKGDVRDEKLLKKCDLSELLEVYDWEVHNAKTEEFIYIN